MSISVAVLMKDVRLGKVIAQELAKKENSMKVTVCLSSEKDEDFDVYVTDYYDQVADKTCWVDTSAISMEGLYRQLMELAGEKAFSTEKSRPAIIGFRSSWGGSGVTASAMTMARLLAEKWGGKILFLNFSGNSGFKNFLSIDHLENSRNLRELAFRLKFGEKVCMDSFISSDEMGVAYLDLAGVLENEFASETMADKLIEICGQLGYGWIVVDLGSQVKSWCDHIYSIHMDGDKRYVFGKEAGQEVAVVRDFRSFRIEAGRVEIALDGDFGDQIRSLTKCAVSGLLKEK